MTHDLEHNALQGELVPGEYAQKHEAHVADAGIGHHPLEVRLRKGEHSTVEDPHDTQSHGHPGEVRGGLRKERVEEAQHPVGADLDEQTGEHHATRSGGLRVSVG